MAVCDYRSERGGRTPPRIKRRNTCLGQMETLAPLLPQGSKTDRLRRDAATVLGCVRVRSTPGGGPAGAGVRVEQVAWVKGLCVAGLSVPSTVPRPRSTTSEDVCWPHLAPGATRWGWWRTLATFCTDGGYKDAHSCWRGEAHVGGAVAGSGTGPWPVDQQRGRRDDSEAPRRPALTAAAAAVADEVAAAAAEDVATRLGTGRPGQGPRFFWVAV